MEHKKVVYITGGSKGIGLGIAQYLLQKDFQVAISSRQLKSAQQAAESLKGNKENILALQSDVCNAEDEQQAVKKILDKWGRLDVLVANAGVGHFAPIEELTHKQWNEVINTNVTGVFHSVKASVDAIKKSKGYIITIASLAGTYFSEKGTAYNASKFAMVGFTQALMLDLRQHDVKVTTIMPGSVTSHFNNHVPSAEDAWKIQPEDIGEMVYDLLKMNPRVLPSKIEVRPAKPPVKK
ncbi:MAG: SDR family oxidoreductase [Bacteroidetes bacterium]|nr:3-phenylpropionate-dihydrodiol/cinnamic acid-dihydrodiol dehydrogenase [Bacteroidia bacterium]MBX3107041.1 SDR family oxidoreductase [Bacteroidota bacterium]MCB8930527.1 SDR family oxidoreductase [Bacteroidia bacterium]MCO5289216.1 SDR family oxidoreductase [Bacteroidota bacterium]MCW5930455.1 SDR family oxidoreductase [Bacteroidota bacterium]